MPLDPKTGEYVIKLTPPPPLPPNVITCPLCGGSGKDPHNTGGFVWSPTELRIRPGGLCPTCRGHKYVKIEPYAGG